MIVLGHKFERIPYPIERWDVVYSGECVYLIVIKGKHTKRRIVYIGKTIHLRQRIGGHWKLCVIKDRLLDGDSIEVYYYPTNHSYQLERVFINRKKPKYNFHIARTEVSNNYKAKLEYKTKKPYESPFGVKEVNGKLVFSFNC